MDISDTQHRVTLELPIRDLFEAFVSAPSLASRTEAFIKIVRELRADPGPRWQESILVQFLGALEASPELQGEFGAALSALLAETDSTNLIAMAGIPGHRGFLGEFGDRLASQLLPIPRDDHDLMEVMRRLYRFRNDRGILVTMPLDLFHRLARLVGAATSKETWSRLKATLAEGFRLLLTRVESEGLSPKLRARATPCAVSASPFHRIRAAGETLISGWLAGEDVSDAASRFRKVSGECRKEARVIQAHLENAGVSVDIVFSLGVIDRCLTRTALLTEVLETPEGPQRSRAIQRLLSRLVLSVREDRSLWHLFGWNLHLLLRKIVDRSGETGEHYIARDRKEYRHIWLAAAGGGALTVVTAAVKVLIHGWHLPALPEGLMYGLNYAVSFLCLQHLGLILATKQPAMTAAHLASIVRDSEGQDREDQIADTAARLTSSQFAAAISNVTVVGAGAALFAHLFFQATGRPFIESREALVTLGGLSPVRSLTAGYAILTGVVLWLASIAGGWFDNWCVYHRIPEGIARHPLGATLGQKRFERAARAVSTHAAGWGTNIALGFMLGMVPEFGRFSGVPLDVRHVTLNTGILCLAASGVDGGPQAVAFLLHAVAGVALMFVLNLSVSFACSLLSATRAYELPDENLAGILKQIGRRILRRPLEFIRPPGGKTGRRLQAGASPSSGPSN